MPRRDVTWCSLALAGASLGSGCGRINYDLLSREEAASSGGTPGSGATQGSGASAANAGAASGGTANTGGTDGGSSSITGGAEADPGGAGAIGAGASPGNGGAGNNEAGSGSGGDGSTACVPSGNELCDGVDNDCDDVTDNPPVCPSGCRSASYAGHDYQFCDVTLTWDDAKADCESKAMKLVRIDDAPEEHFVWNNMLSYIMSNPYNRADNWIWLGGTDAGADGEWSWTDGDLFWSGGSGGAVVPGYYSHWVAGDLQAPTENCLQLETVELWTPFECGVLRRYACEAY